MNHRLLFVVATFLMLSACLSPTTDSTVGVEADTVTSRGMPGAALRTDQNVQKIAVATYDDAAAYTGATDYYFTLENGERVIVRVSNEETAKKPEVPSNLLDAAAEGVPGPNSDRLGKNYRLTYNQEGLIVRIEADE